MNFGAPLMIPRFFVYAIERCYLDVVILGGVERVELQPGNGLLVRGDTVHRGVGWGCFEEGGDWIAGELEEVPQRLRRDRDSCTCVTCRGATQSDCRCVAPGKDGIRRVINCRGLRLHVYLGSGGTASVPKDDHGYTLSVVSDVDFEHHKLTFDEQFGGGHVDPDSTGYVAGSIREGRAGTSVKHPLGFPCVAPL